MMVDGKEDGNGKLDSSLVNGLESMDAEVIRCLDAVDRMLCLRESVAEVLRKGWMDLASARYSMGPARISQPLFSLQPSQASAAVSVSSLLADDASGSNGESAVDESENKSKSGLIQFSLVDLSVRSNETAVASTWDRRRGLESSASGLWRRPVATKSENLSMEEMQQALEENYISDSETDLDMDISQRKISKPLTWFGALVSPHVRSAQRNFQAALLAIVDIANAQSAAMHAHAKILNLQSCAPEYELPVEEE